MRSLETIPGSTSMTRAICSSVVHRPRENLIDPWAISCESPMASSTWEGSSVEEVQAEPVEAAIPSMSSDRSIDSPSMK